MEKKILLRISSFQRLIQIKYFIGAGGKKLNTTNFACNYTSKKILNFDLKFYIFGVHPKKYLNAPRRPFFTFSVIIVFFVALLFLNILHCNNNRFIKKICCMIWDIN